MSDIVEDLKNEAVRLVILNGGNRVSSRDVTESVIFKGALEIERLRGVADEEFKYRLAWEKSYAAMKERAEAAEALVAEGGAMAKALEQCVDALSRCYDVNDWPADGRTIQDEAIRTGNAVLAARKEPVHE